MPTDSRILEGAVPREESLDALIRRAQGGEEAAFEEILARFESRALLIARTMGATRQDAEDIAQDAFLKLFRYIGAYRSERTFRAYFFRIVVNAARDHLGALPPASVASIETSAVAPRDEGAATFEEVETLRRALASLSQREREVIILRDVQGLSTWECARVLRLSPVTVRRHASRAHARLKEILGEGRRPGGAGPGHAPTGPDD